MKVSTSLPEAVLVQALRGGGLEVRGSHLIPDARLAGKHLIVVDAYLPSLRAVVEYDGAYWHAKRRRADIRKAKTLLRAGYRVVRVREAPLPSLGEVGLGYFEVAVAAGVAPGDEVAQEVLGRLG